MEWSKDVYKLHDVIEYLNLPCLVRVEGNYDNESKMQRFSSGDVLRIDTNSFKKCVTMQKVHTVTNALSDDFFVPLEFKTFFQTIVPDENKRYSFLNQVLEQFPRIVMANVTFTSPISKVFTKGSQFEVLGVFGVDVGKRLLVQYNGEELFLPAFTAGSFSCVEDKNVFLLKDCRKISPCFVKPLNRNFDKITKLANDEILQICSIRDMKVVEGHFICWPGLSQGRYSINDCKMGKFILSADSHIEMYVQKGKLRPGFELDDADLRFEHGENKSKNTVDEDKHCQPKVPGNNPINTEGTFACLFTKNCFSLLRNIYYMFKKPVDKCPRTTGHRKGEYYGLHGN